MIKLKELKEHNLLFIHDAKNSILHICTLTEKSGMRSVFDKNDSFLCHYRIKSKSIVRDFPTETSSREGFVLINKAIDSCACTSHLFSNNLFIVATNMYYVSLEEKRKKVGLPAVQISTIKIKHTDCYEEFNKEDFTEESWLKILMDVYCLKNGYQIHDFTEKCSILKKYHRSKIKQLFKLW